MSCSVRLAVISLLLLGSLSAAPTPWAKLKVGMSGDEIVSLLGEPVFRRQGHGFETWTYDHGAEVLICGVAMGWTTPASTMIGARSEDVWSNHPQGDYYAPVRSVLRQNAAKLAAAKAQWEKSRTNSGMGYEEYLRTYGRNKS
jgi:hypothetical protein